MQLKNRLAKLPLMSKIWLLVFAACALYLSNFFITAATLSLHFILIGLLVATFTVVAFDVLERRAFNTMFKLWLIGTMVYLVFAVPRIYFTSALSPYFVFNSLLDRWLYSLLLPLLLLGTFSIGLTMMRVTSSTEFLGWGRIGLKIALVFRSLEHAVQMLSDTKTVLIMQDKWPEDNCKLFSLRKTYLVIRYSPLLVGTALRNIICYWFPWGWICFKRISGENKQQVTIRIRTVLVLILAGVTAALSILVRIPTPATGGYLNLGDMAVIFSGLFLGGVWGAVAGGFGSALADLIGGFFIFTPITLLIKGGEALLAGTIGRKHPIFLGLAGVVVIVGYFIAEIFIPGMGWSAAISELPFNTIQATIGVFGGWFIYRRVVSAIG